jgi:hypothetical protein
VVVLPSGGGTGSSAIVPHAMGAGRTADRTADGTADKQEQQPQAPMAPAAVQGGAQGGSSSSSSSARAGSATAPSSSSSADAYARANEMARELGQALGAFGKGAAGANLTLTAGRSVEQVGGAIHGRAISSALSVCLCSVLFTCCCTQQAGQLTRSYLQMVTARSLTCTHRPCPVLSTPAARASPSCLLLALPHRRRCETAPSLP